MGTKEGGFTMNPPVARTDKLAFLLKHLIVVVRNPLIAVPSDPFDCGGFVIVRAQAVLRDNTRIPTVLEQRPGSAPPKIHKLHWEYCTNCLSERSSGHTRTKRLVHDYFQQKQGTLGRW